ncbi:hypothetical protein [Tumebacillus permanentifrigoris]|uniref:Holin n=1 Tax=Tumebacillus permanentifrigoris TaxID=378543 RepID=A0A316D4D3_9BACL|nr:hypothetical protein [Tumebacillus permanentifrigoris]PWK05292.1 hypothetical protein C7459_12441 [Tumebacillus permanentifrigoris]
MKEKLKSRKFWTAVITATVLVANDGLGMHLNGETVLAIAGIAMTYIFGQAHVDAKGVTK